MLIPTDHITLLQSLGAYAFASTTNSELGTKLQTIPGSTVDRIFTATEMLYSFRDELDQAGLTLLAQLAGFALSNHWDFPAQPGRMKSIYDSTMGAVGEATLATDFEQPAPVTHYRTDQKDWRESVTPNLDQLKAGKRAKVNQIRDEKQNGPAPTPFGPVDNDDSSKIKLNGAVTMAMLATQQQQAFAIDWTMHDNSVVACDAVKMMQLGEAAGAHVAAVHKHSTELKAQIEAIAVVDTGNATADLKTAVDALSAIDINAGWPA